MKKAALLCTAVWLMFMVSAAWSYPLDSYDETGIPRLEGYYHSLRTALGKENFVPGQLLSVNEISLLPAAARKELPAVDPDLSFKLKLLLGPYAQRVSFAVLDLSNPAAPVLGELNGRQVFVPGSVGKLMVAVALFDALAKLYPDSAAKRYEILRNRMITATDFVEGDSHEVPFWSMKNENVSEVTFRTLQTGDTASLFTYLDWMLSASSNAAGSMVMREAVLMNYLGRAYPPSPEQEGVIWQSLSREARVRLMRRTFEEPISALGLSPARLKQASLFTKAGRNYFPGLGSTATTHDLLTLLYLIEQGRVIDRFSSLELKRLLYATQKRTRYAESRALDMAAVYYKSGSMYACAYDPNFACGKYQGNVKNLLHTAAIIESPAENPRHKYLVALSTNVLKRNSSDLHAEIARLIEALITTSGRSNPARTGGQKEL